MAVARGHSTRTPAACRLSSLALTSPSATAPSGRLGCRGVSRPAALPGTRASVAPYRGRRRLLKGSAQASSQLVREPLQEPLRKGPPRR